MRRIGILGGMGPQATILLMQKVLAGVDATDDADHVPLVVDQNTQIPSRIRHLIEKVGQDPGPALADSARRLVAGGAEALAMPCNTAHHYAQEIRTAVGVPLLNMVDLSAAHAASLTDPGGCVGILGSPAVRKVRLFEDALAAHGLTVLYAQEEEDMLAAIRLIKSRGPHPDASETLSKASQRLLERGAEVQLIACTEFSLIPEAVCPNSIAFDTLDRLVLGIVHFSKAAHETGR